MKLSVVVLTRNEEKNIGDCLESVKGIADEIIVLDEHSTDKTREIAKKYGVKLYEVDHEAIFHVNKQKALEKAKGEWILQLDADERVSSDLAKEILAIIAMDDEVISCRKIPKLFLRHQKLVEKRDLVGTQTGEVTAFYVPRLNYFLGKPLRHAGVYPDGVIRLIKNGKARFPAKSVHEQIEVDGKVSWLINDLYHHDSPTLTRYFARLNRYTDLHAEELVKKKAPRNLFYMSYYGFIRASLVFGSMYLRHGGFKDGSRGFMWCFLSASHYPIAYFKYWSVR